MQLLQRHVPLHSGEHKNIFQSKRNWKEMSDYNDNTLFNNVINEKKESNNIEFYDCKSLILYYDQFKNIKTKLFKKTSNLDQFHSSIQYCWVVFHTPKFCEKIFAT